MQCIYTVNHIHIYTSIYILYIHTYKADVKKTKNKQQYLDSLLVLYVTTTLQHIRLQTTNKRTNRKEAKTKKEERKERIGIGINGNINNLKKRLGKRDKRKM